jgi:hypothetical protein
MNNVKTRKFNYQKLNHLRRLDVHRQHYGQEEFDHNKADLFESSISVLIKKYAPLLHASLVDFSAMHLIKKIVVSILIAWIGYSVGYIGVAKDNPILIIFVFLGWIYLDSSLFRTTLMFFFFAGASEGIPNAIEIYNEVTTKESYIGFLIQLIALTIPFALFSFFRWGILAGSILLLLSPIGWLNPLILSGVLFPGTAFVGLMALSLLVVLYKNKMLVAGLLIASAVLNIKTTIFPFKSDNDAYMANTSYGVPVKEIDSMYNRYKYIIDSSYDTSKDQVKIFFPETHLLNLHSFERVRKIFEDMSLKEGKVIISGYYDQINNENQIVVFKEGKTVFLNTQASALSPKKGEPWINEGTKWHLLDKPIVIDGDLLIVCFEEYHLGLFLWKMITADKPITKVVGMENLWWSSESRNSMVVVQRMYARIASRLFGLDYKYVYND